MWTHLLNFLYKIPLYVIIYFALFYFKDYIYFINFISLKPDSYIGHLANLITFLVIKFAYFSVFKAYNYLVVKFISTSAYKNYLRKKNTYYSKVTPKSSGHFYSWVFKVPSLSPRYRDKYSLELLKQSLEITKEINEINRQLRTPENSQNLALLKKFSVKLCELIEIIEKHEKHTRNL